MYFFVPYNISDIQKGIQAGHAALEYALEHGDTDEYKSFISYDKTWIILNGGTTNNERVLGSGVSIGNLNQIMNSLCDHKIPCASFQEPDLNQALTAVCFIADDRVWDWENYPSFDEYIVLNGLHISDEILRSQYLNLVGGKKNVFLKELINGKSLA